MNNPYYRPQSKLRKQWAWKRSFKGALTVIQASGFMISDY